jgi:hypothetical protein
MLTVPAEAGEYHFENRGLYEYTILTPLSQFTKSTNFFSSLYQFQSHVKPGMLNRSCIFTFELSKTTEAKSVQFHFQYFLSVEISARSLISDISL